MQCRNHDVRKGAGSRLKGGSPVLYPDLAILGATFSSFALPLATRLTTGDGGRQRSGFVVTLRVGDGCGGEWSGSGEASPLPGPHAVMCLSIWIPRLQRTADP